MCTTFNLIKNLKDLFEAIPETIQYEIFSYCSSAKRGIKIKIGQGIATVRCSSSQSKSREC